jgi:hypothetical protein
LGEPLISGIKEALIGIRLAEQKGVWKQKGKKILLEFLKLTQIEQIDINSCQ